MTVVESLVLEPDGFQLPGKESDFKEPREHFECYKSLCLLHKSSTNTTTLQTECQLFQINFDYWNNSLRKKPY